MSHAGLYQQSIAERKAVCRRVVAVQRHSRTLYVDPHPSARKESKSDAADVDVAAAADVHVLWARGAIVFEAVPARMELSLFHQWLCERELLLPERFPMDCNGRQVDSRTFCASTEPLRFVVRGAQRCLSHDLAFVPAPGTKKGSIVSPAEPVNARCLWLAWCCVQSIGECSRIFDRSQA